MMQIVEQFELAGATTKVGHADQPQIAEQLQRTVDRRAVDPRQERLDASEDFVGGEMLPRSKRAQDDQPLRRDALADAAQTIGESTRADRFFRTVHAISFEVHRHPTAVVYMTLSGANVSRDLTAGRSPRLLTERRNPHSISRYAYANVRICIDLKLSSRVACGVLTNLTRRKLTDMADPGILSLAGLGIALGLR